MQKHFFASAATLGLCVVALATTTESASAQGPDQTMMLSKNGTSIITAAPLPPVTPPPVMKPVMVAKPDLPKEKPAPVVAPEKPVEPTVDVIPLTTFSGLDVGGRIGGYRYREAGIAPDVTISGAKVSLTLDATKLLRQGYFVEGQMLGSFGPARYQGSGSIDAQSDFYLEGRALVGKDFQYQDVGLSPYLGLGYRYLFNDIRGTTSTGARGYRRENQLLYVPLGLTPRFRLDNETRLAPQIEVDYVLQGTQNSSFSDVGPGAPDLQNKQSSGYGARANFLLETKTWAVGPYLTYWDIQKSDTVCATRSSLTICGLEPHNTTFEAGFLVKYKFHAF